jgi:ketosteroid isomerase-like protein
MVQIVECRPPLSTLREARMPKITKSVDDTLFSDAHVHPVAKAGYDAFNRRDFASLDAIYDERTEIINLATGERLVGVAGVTRFMKAWVEGFSDAKAEITDIKQAGDTVICEFRGTGTHDGVFKAPAGDIPATGKKVDVQFCDVLRIENDRVVQIKSYFDSGTFARQLGVDAV